MKTNNKRLRDVLVQHGIAARSADYGKFVVWQDAAGRFNNAYSGPYAFTPRLIRLYCNVAVASVRGRIRHPEGERSEITFLPSEFSRVAEEFARRTARGEPLRQKFFTPEAWRVNPHRALDADDQPGSPLPGDSPIWELGYQD
jgi:hypothetical protein